MESLESCVQNLDMRSMPQFLDQVSDAPENEASRHFAISLYAELAQVHKQAVIPFIPRMMASIVRSLPFSADSQQLHEACAKVVSLVARYTIDPTGPHDSNQQILCNLCSPLLPMLSSKVESAAIGAAICLQALVESEKWKFAPSDLQDVICTKATAALVEQGTQAVAFFHLLKSLAKFCKKASKEYAGEWLGVGLKVLQADTALWQKRLAAAQLITTILKTADADNLGLNLPLIMKILEACMLDKVTVVQTAVAEAFETAKVIGREKHLLCAGSYENSRPGKAGSFDSSCESQRRFSDTEESGMQDLSGSGSPRSGASSQEAVPSMSSSTVKFGTEPKRLKRRGKNASCLSHLNGSLTRTSMLMENTPATMPRRVLSEIPASGKRFSNSDFLPSSWEATSLRRSSMDLGSKAAAYSTQSQALLGSRKFSQHVPAPIDNGAKKTDSLVKKHADGCQNISSIECRCTENKQSVSLESTAGGQSDINSKEGAKTDEEVNEWGKKSVKTSPEHPSQKIVCLQDSITNKFDKDAGPAYSGVLLKDTGISKDSPEEITHLKLGNSHNPPQDFAFRAPCNLLHSIKGNGSTKDSRPSSKECSDCENKAPSGVCWTTSDSLVSGDSEEGQSVSINFHNSKATVANCCRTEVSDTCKNQTHKISSHTYRCGCRNTSKSPRTLSPNDSENSAFGHGWPSSRESSDRECDHNVKARYTHVNSSLRKCSKGNGAKRHRSAHTEDQPRLPTAPDIKFREVQLSGRVSDVPIFKGQICVGVALGLFCAVGALILALMVIQRVNHNYSLHLLVPT